MKFKFTAIALLLLSVSLMFLSGVVSAQKNQTKVKAPNLESISTIPPRQMIKELTASPYLFVKNNDFDRDGIKEIIIGARCIEEFCHNYIFKILNNKRYQYLGMAQFNQEVYELIWKEGSTLPDILFFKQENVGQGCLGRYKYQTKEGYILEYNLCQLPKRLAKILNSNKAPEIFKEPRENKGPDFIDFSNIKFEDNPEDLFPE